MAPGDRTVHDLQRGPGTTVPGNYILDSDGRPLDDDIGLPSIDSTPKRSEPSDGPRFAHALVKPTRRERRALKKQRRRERATVIGRHPKLSILLVVLIVLTPLWVSLGSAATNPALGPSMGSRLTEWVRDHGGGGVVTWAENTWYTWHAPPKGGKPVAGAIPKPVASTTTVPVATGPAHLAAPAAIVPFVSTPTAGEGQWHVIGRTVDGIPTTYAAYLRPNAVYTSVVAGVAWMDTKLLAAKLYAGTTIPGNAPSTFAEAPITGAALTTLDAAFNSGFRMQDADGGFYLDGVTSVALRPGAASLVIDDAGNVNIGAWGTDVTMTPTTAAVRQNLDLIVDNGAPVPGLDANDNHRWGFTLGSQGPGVAVGRRGHRRRCPGLCRRERPLHRRPGQPADPGRIGAGHGDGHQSGLGELHELAARRRRHGLGAERRPAHLRPADQPQPVLRDTVPGLRHHVGAPVLGACARSHFSK